MTPLPGEFYARPVLEVAPELIGCTVTHGATAGVIVETEAYHESEPASHAFAGLTPRTKTLFGEPGRAYIYRSYGIHALLNAVCEPAGIGSGVLIRALLPLSGIEEMRSRRGLIAGRPARDDDLCSGTRQAHPGDGHLAGRERHQPDHRTDPHPRSRRRVARSSRRGGDAHRHNPRGRAALALLRRSQPPRLAPPALEDH